jgi:DHA1 family tetracycline resistance protein-like MFS transporter
MRDKPTSPRARDNSRDNRWQQWVEPWYIVYALLGATVAGLIPVLLPLVVIGHGSIAQVGLVMAAVSLGGLSAPLWGSLADRYRLHRWILVTGLLFSTAGLAVFPFVSRLGGWFALALVQSIGAAGAATIANLFVVEAHPKAEWDERIGWLQTFYGLGQVAGLILASIFSQLDLSVGLWSAAGLTALAVLLGWLTTKTPPRPTGTKPVLLHPARHIEWAMSSPQRLFHFVDAKTFRKLGASLRSPFGLFLLVWLLTFSGSAAAFSQYPLLMKKLFDIQPGPSSIAFAAMAGLGLVLYSPAGAWSDRYGPLRVLRASIGVRLLAFIGLFILGILLAGPRGWLAILAFTIIVLAWSLMSVSGTALAARLSPVGEGEGMGIFNALTALSGVIGAVLGGWAAGIWGYNAITLFAVSGVALGLALSTALPHSYNRKTQKLPGSVPAGDRLEHNRTVP